jgi:predicted AlkP superfamily pyrophosphatase or phosphodiesterase
MVSGTSSSRSTGKEEDRLHARPPVVGDQSQGMKAIKRLTALLWAQLHLKQSIALCNLAMSLTENQRSREVISGLWAGLAVTYGRSFKHSNGISALDPKFSSFPSDQLQRRHDWLLDKRDRQFAHKDRLWEEAKAKHIGFEEELPKIMLEVFGNGNTEWEVKGLEYPNVRFSDFKELCEFQRTRLAQESDRMILHQVKSHEVKPGVYDLERDFPN